MRDAPMLGDVQNVKQWRLGNCTIGGTLTTFLKFFPLDEFSNYPLGYRAVEHS